MNKKGIESELLFKIVEMTIVVIALIFILLPLFSVFLTFYNHGDKSHVARRVFLDSYSSLKSYAKYHSSFSVCLPYSQYPQDYEIQYDSKYFVLYDSNGNVVIRREMPLKVGDEGNLFLNQCKGKCFLGVRYSSDDKSLNLKLYPDFKNCLYTAKELNTLAANEKRSFAEEFKNIGFGDSLDAGEVTKNGVIIKKYDVFIFPDHSLILKFGKSSLIYEISFYDSANRLISTYDNSGSGGIKVNVPSNAVNATVNVSINGQFTSFSKEYFLNFTYLDRFIDSVILTPESPANILSGNTINIPYRFLSLKFKVNTIKDRLLLSHLFTRIKVIVHDEKKDRSIIIPNSGSIVSSISLGKSELMNPIFPNSITINFTFSLESVRNPSHKFVSKVFKYKLRRNWCGYFPSDVFKVTPKVIYFDCREDSCNAKSNVNISLQSPQVNDLNEHLSKVSFMNTENVEYSSTFKQYLKSRYVVLSNLHLSKPSGDFSDSLFDNILQKSYVNLKCKNSKSYSLPAYFVNYNLLSNALTLKFNKNSQETIEGNTITLIPDENNHVPKLSFNIIKSSAWNAFVSDGHFGYSLTVKVEKPKLYTTPLISDESNFPNSFTIPSGTLKTNDNLIIDLIIKITSSHFESPIVYTKKYTYQIIKNQPNLCNFVTATDFKVTPAVYFNCIGSSCTLNSKTPLFINLTSAPSNFNLDKHIAFLSFLDSNKDAYSSSYDIDPTNSNFIKISSLSLICPDHSSGCINDSIFGKFYINLSCKNGKSFIIPVSFLNLDKFKEGFGLSILPKNYLSLEENTLKIFWSHLMSSSSALIKFNIIKSNEFSNFISQHGGGVSLDIRSNLGTPTNQFFTSVPQTFILNIPKSSEILGSKTLKLNLTWHLSLPGTSSGFTYSKLFKYSLQSQIDLCRYFKDNPNSLSLSENLMYLKFADNPNSRIKHLYSIVHGTGILDITSELPAQKYKLTKDLFKAIDLEKYNSSTKRYDDFGWISPLSVDDSTDDNTLSSNKLRFDLTKKGIFSVSGKGVSYFSNHIFGNFSLDFFCKDDSESHLYFPMFFFGESVFNKSFSLALSSGGKLLSQTITITSNRPLTFNIVDSGDGIFSNFLSKYSTHLSYTLQASIPNRDKAIHLGQSYFSPFKNWFNVPVELLKDGDKLKLNLTFMLKVNGVNAHFSKIFIYSVKKENAQPHLNCNDVHATDFKATSLIYFKEMNNHVLIIDHEKTPSLKITLESGSSDLKKCFSSPFLELDNSSGDTIPSGFSGFSISEQSLEVTNINIVSASVLSIITDATAKVSFKSNLERSPLMFPVYLVNEHQLNKALNLSLIGGGTLNKGTITSSHDASSLTFNIVHSRALNNFLSSNVGDIRLFIKAYDLTQSNQVILDSSTSNVPNQMTLPLSALNPNDRFEINLTLKFNKENVVKTFSFDYTFKREKSFFQLLDEATYDIEPEIIFYNCFNSGCYLSTRNSNVNVSSSVFEKDTLIGAYVRKASEMGDVFEFSTIKPRKNPHFDHSFILSGLKVIDNGLVSHFKDDILTHVNISLDCWYQENYGSTSGSKDESVLAYFVNEKLLKDAMNISLTIQDTSGYLGTDKATYDKSTNTITLPLSGVRQIPFNLLISKPMKHLLLSYPSSSVSLKITDYNQTGGYVLMNQEVDINDLINNLGVAYNLYGFKPHTNKLVFNITFVLFLNHPEVTLRYSKVYSFRVYDPSQDVKESFDNFLPSVSNGPFTISPAVVFVKCTDDSCDSAKSLFADSNFELYSDLVNLKTIVGSSNFASSDNLKLHKPRFHCSSDRSCTSSNSFSNIKVKVGSSVVKNGYREVTFTLKSGMTTYYFPIYIIDLQRFSSNYVSGIYYNNYKSDQKQTGRIMFTESVPKVVIQSLIPHITLSYYISNDGSTFSSPYYATLNSDGSFEVPILSHYFINNGKSHKVKFCVMWSLISLQKCDTYSVP